MHTIQIADQTFIAAAPHRVACLIADRNYWHQWWPSLTLHVVEDRADKGIRWQVQGYLSGTMEIWLEPILDGVTMHYFLHAEPTYLYQASIKDTPLTPRTIEELNHRYRVKGKHMAFSIKIRAEQGRPAGTPAIS